MPVRLDISNFKCFNQLRNGSDFSANTGAFTNTQVGNVLETIKLSYEATFNYFSNASISNSWNVKADKITRANGNFQTNDSLVIGDEITFFADWENFDTATPEFTAIITGFADGGRTALFSLTSGSQVTTGNNTNAGFICDPSESDNFHTAMINRFGLVPNDDSYSNNSLVSDNSQSYAVVGMNGITAPITGNAEGIYKDWVTGSFDAYISTVNSDYSVTYQVDHVLIITPSYIVGYLENFQNGTVPDFFAGDSSLKYTFELELRKTKTDTGTAKKVVFDTLLGSVGWFNENFNGGLSDYSVANIAYKDTATTESKTALQASRKTTSTIIVAKASTPFLSGQVLTAYVQYLPLNASEYTDTTTAYQDNFLYDTIRIVEGAGNTTGTGIIKRARAVLAGSNISLELDLEYSAQQALTVTDGNYLIAVSCEDSALLAGNSDRVMVLADVNEYLTNSIIDSLVSFDSFQFYVYDRVVGVDAPASTMQAWNEDLFVSECVFSLDLAKSAILSSLNFSVVAYDTVNDTYFKLDSFQFDTTEAIVFGGVQQIDENLSRNYNVEVGSQFNLAQIETLGRVGDIQSYRLRIGQQIPFQSWLFNQNADSVFYDNTQPQNGLNFLSSNYANGNNNYQIRVLLEAGVSGVDDLGLAQSGTAIGSSANIELYDFDLDGNAPPEWSAVFRTLDPDTLEDLEGQISYDKDTLYEVEWTYSSVLTTSAIIFCWHAIAPSNATGYPDNFISNLYTKENSILKPLEGEIFLTVDLELGKIVSRCLIDYTKLNNTKYNFTARIQR